MVPADAAYVLGYTMRDIDGGELDLSTLKGKVVLLVNVASRCGLTPQYEALQALYASKKDAGLVVVGIPSNDFNGQEPGGEAEIKEFCTSRYGVTFPMLAKISVRGENRHPLYAQLASLPEPLGGEPRWNFTKFLLDRSGRVVARFEPRKPPDDPAVVARIDELLSSG
jgi:glutathione peroxidase